LPGAREEAHSSAAAEQLLCPFWGHSVALPAGSVEWKVGFSLGICLGVKVVDCGCFFHLHFLFHLFFALISFGLLLLLAGDLFYSRTLIQLRIPYVNSSSHTTEAVHW
jgi:hypothetical protein